MKLKFSPAEEWLVVFEKLESAVRQLPAPRPVNLQKIYNDIYLDKVPTPLPVLEKILSKATEAQAKNIVYLFMNLWNITPRAAFDGKTPNQMAAHVAAQAPGRSADTSGWTKVMELMLHIQGTFQAELYDVLKGLEPKSQEVAIAYSHRLFERYFSTVLEELLPDQVAPADLVAGHLAHEGVKLPKNAQAQIRVFKTPVNKPAPDRRMRMTVGQEAVEAFPVVSDWLSGRKKSEMYTKDLYYNRLLAEVVRRQPDTEIQVMAAAWGYAIETWRASSAPLRKAYEPQEWHSWWIKQFDLAAKEWVSTDDIFRAIIDRTHTKVMPMQTVVDLLQAPKGQFIEPQGLEELGAYMALFDAQVGYARDFVGPLTTYLPIIEVRYTEPLVLAEELDRMPTNAKAFVDYISKPPSYFTLRSPLGRRLWKKIKKELM